VRRVRYQAARSRPAKVARWGAGGKPRSLVFSNGLSHFSDVLSRPFGGRSGNLKRTRTGENPAGRSEVLTEGAGRWPLRRERDATPHVVHLGAAIPYIARNPPVLATPLSRCGGTGESRDAGEKGNNHWIFTGLSTGLSTGMAKFSITILVFDLRYRSLIGGGTCCHGIGSPPPIPGEEAKRKAPEMVCTSRAEAVQQTVCST
jgi:hypothetical protein